MLPVEKIVCAVARFESHFAITFKTTLKVALPIPYERDPADINRRRPAAIRLERLFYTCKHTVDCLR